MVFLDNPSEEGNGGTFCTLKRQKSQTNPVLTDDAFGYAGLVGKHFHYTTQCSTPILLTIWEPGQNTIAITVDVIVE